MKKYWIAVALALVAAPNLSRADQPMGQDGSMMKDESMKMDKPKATKKDRKAKAMYKCPMDGTMSEKPGKCAKCGMEMQMVKLTPGVKHSPAEITAAARSWHCPMDGAVSDKPGKCPKCGMDMVEVKDETKPTDTK